MSALSLEFGPYLAVLTLTFLKTPREVGQLALTMSLEIAASSQHYYNRHQAISLSTDRSTLVPSPVCFPPGSQVSGEPLPGGPGTQAKGEEGWGRGQFMQTLV